MRLRKLLMISTFFPSLAQLFVCGIDRVGCRGREIATDFETLPNRKRYPDYFVTIKKPIALDTILERIEKEEYDDTEALKADLTQMTANAKKYNVKGSIIYDNAVTIQVPFS